MGLKQFDFNLMGGYLGDKVGSALNNVRNGASSASKLNNNSLANAGTSFSKFGTSSSNPGAGPGTGSGAGPSPGAGSGSSNGGLLYGNPQGSSPQWTPTRTPMRDAAELAKEYGITYDLATIEGKFNDATKAQYDMLRKEFGATENKFYNDMYNNQQTALDTIRKSNAAAVATGASKGMQAANELSSVLNLQQQGTEGATQLAVDKNLLNDKEGAAIKQNALDAMSMANQAGMGLGNLNANLYATDTQFDVGQMDYYARLDAAMKQLMGMQEQASATRYNADKNAEATKYAANVNASATKYAANVNANMSQKQQKDMETALNSAVKNNNKAAYVSYCTSNGIPYDKANEMWDAARGPQQSTVANAAPKTTSSATAPNWGGSSKPIY